jgi:hypothetical protein
MNQQKKIIIFTIIIFVLSSVTLFYINNSYLNTEVRKDYWSIYFNNPVSGSMDFAIENHSFEENFIWQIQAAGQLIQEGKTQVAKGEIKNIILHMENPGIKITITVTAGDEKKEIYKNK